MLKAPIPADDDLRLQDLLSYEILDSVEDEDLNSLVELAAFICGCPIAAISFVDKDRQWFKARKNLPVAQTSRDISFCAHAILQDGIMIVPDASLDERFHDNPLVTSGIRIAFYAGVPIVSTAGHSLGSICVIDRKAKAVLSPEQTEGLKIISKQISHNLELKLKNKLLAQHAETILNQEREVSLQTFTEQESELTYIASQLHENFAQTLAATKLYLEFAQQSVDMQPQLLQKSKENLESIINEIRILAKSIVPTTLPQQDTIGLLKELSDQWTVQTGTPVEFSYLKNKADADIDAIKGLVLYRILQQKFKLSNYYHPENITVHLQLIRQKGWNMEFAFDTTHIAGETIEPDLLVRNISSRAVSAHGALEMTEEEDRITLKVVLPE